MPWELTRKEPIVDIRLIGHRQFGTSWFVMLSVGMILFSSTQFMPQLLQENFGYTATLAGLALMPGGFAALVMMVIAGRVSGLVQPRYLMAGAMITIAVAMYHFTSLTPDVNFGWFALARVFQMAAIPVLVPDDHQLFLRRACRPRNRARPRPSSMWRAISAAASASRWRKPCWRGANSSTRRGLPNMLSASSLAYRQTLSEAGSYFAAHGATGPDAQSRAVAWVGETLMNQAAYLSYIDVFAALAGLAALLVPVAFLLRRVDLGRSGGVVRLHRRQARFESSHSAQVTPGRRENSSRSARGPVTLVGQDVMEPQLAFHVPSCGFFEIVLTSTANPARPHQRLDGGLVRSFRRRLHGEGSVTRAQHERLGPLQGPKREKADHGRGRAKPVLTAAEAEADHRDQPQRRRRRDPLRRGRPCAEWRRLR